MRTNADPLMDELPIDILIGDLDEELTVEYVHQLLTEGCINEQKFGNIIQKIIFDEQANDSLIRCFPPEILDSILVALIL